MLNYNNDSRKIIKKYIYEKPLDVLLATDDSLKTNKNSYDIAIEHKQAMLEHSGKYTEILDVFIQSSTNTSKQKSRFKCIFFYFSIASLGLVTSLFIALSIVLLVIKIDEVSVTALSTLVTAFVSLLSMYIIIPKIIAKYLFNRKEDENMREIIKSIQNYDERVDSHSLDDSKFKKNKEKEKKKRQKSA